MSSIRPADPGYSTGMTARQLGVSVDTIRRWEREGKITATRTPGGQRRFSQAEIDRLRELAAAS